MDQLVEEISNNNFEGIRRILNEIELPWKYNYSDYYILKDSIKNGTKEVALLLIEKGCRVDKIFCNNMINEESPLHLAIKCGYLDIAEALLYKGASIDVQFQSKNVLFAAVNISANFLHMYKIEYLSLVDIMLPLVKHNLISDEGISFIHIACMRNQINIIKRLLQTGVSINHAVKSDSTFFPGFTPMHFAVYYHAREMVELLIDAGADIFITDERLLTPLNYAYNLGNESIINLLSATLISSAFNCFPEYTSLYNAVMHKDSETVKLLLRSGSKIPIINSKDMTPLHLAFKTEKQDIVNIILSENFDISENPVDSTGLSHLHVFCAAYNNAITPEKMSNFFKNHLDSINSRVNFGSARWAGYTPLHFAVEFRAIKTVQELLKVEYGVNVAIKNELDLTPFDLAVECLNAYSASHKLNVKGFQNSPDLNVIIEIIGLFLSEHENRQLEDFDDKGFSVLHVASALNNWQIMDGIGWKCCVDKQINLQSGCWAGCTAAHVAAIFQHFEFLQSLMGYGADFNVRDAMGNTPMHSFLDAWQKLTLVDELPRLATMPNGFKIIQLLFHTEPDLNARNNARVTPTHLQSFLINYGPGTIRQFVFLGADLSAADFDGRTPLDYMLSEPIERMEARRVILSYILASKAAGRPGSLADEETLWRKCERESFERVLREFAGQHSIQCQKELEQMAKLRINHERSLRDILFMNGRKVADLLKNKILRNILDSSDFNHKFPIYLSWLKGLQGLGDMRKNLLDQSEEALITLIKLRKEEVTVNQKLIDCIENILKYLSYNDLIKLIIASKLSSDVL